MLLQQLVPFAFQPRFAQRVLDGDMHVFRLEGLDNVVANTKAKTFDGDLFASLMERFADDVHVESVACADLVTLVESGDIQNPAALATVRRSLEPLLAADVDTLVLGCTHYMFLRDVIAKVVGPGLTIIDPAPAVARQVVRMAREIGSDAGTGTTAYLTTGDPQRFASQLEALLGIEAPVEVVRLTPTT